MLLHAPVRQFMTLDPVTVPLDATPSVVRRLLRDHPFHHVPVVHGHVVVGIVSATDLARVSLDAWVDDPDTVDAELDASFELEQVMSHDPVTIQVGATLQDAARLLADGSFHALPVLDGDRLVGVVTTTDIVRQVAVA